MMWLTLFFSIFGIFLLSANYLRRKIRIRRWRKSLKLDKHETIFQQLYAEMDGFSLSRQARSTHDAPEYLYGEIIFEPFIALLSLCNPNSSTVFYDLGSGIGKAVLACAIVFEVKKSCGIELFSTLHQTAKLQEQRLKTIPGYDEKSCIEFRNENFLETDFSDASLLFINATAFFGELWHSISKHLEQIRPGTLVISTSKPIHSKQFIKLHETKVLMSWGIVSAYIQQRQKKV